MKRDSGTVQRGFLGLVLASIVGIAATGCADVRSESDGQESGMLESPTHEADSLRRAEEQQRRDRNGGGGGGGGGSY